MTSPVKKEPEDDHYQRISLNIGPSPPGGKKPATAHSDDTAPASGPRSLPSSHSLTSTDGPSPSPRPSESVMKPGPRMYESLLNAQMESLEESKVVSEHRQAAEPAPAENVAGRPANMLSVKTETGDENMGKKVRTGKGSVTTEEDEDDDEYLPDTIPETPP